jgi:hybrid cluster-associated redox disulfide protein
MQGLPAERKARMEEMILGLTVSDVLQRWPGSAALFTGRRMACPGCAMAPFMTVREAAREYGQDAAGLAADLIAEAERSAGV